MYSFLMLPATFDHGSKLKVSKQVIGILAVVVLTVGFSLTALLTFAIRNPLFQADAIFLPSLISCALGLLTIFYNFLISSRYVWNIPALLLIVASAVSTIVYGGLSIYTHRKIRIVRSQNLTPFSSMMPLQPETSRETLVSRWQDPGYYENYVRNMFPSSAPRPAPNTGYDPNSITEEEMQRQQMLMLLLQQTQVPGADANSSTFHIDWQGQDQDDSAPAQGFYAPNSSSVGSPWSGYPSSGHSRQRTNDDFRPWDGVWRNPVPVPAAGRGRDTSDQWGARPRSQEHREQRRREIESGR